MASPRKFSTSDADLLEELARQEARESFWAFRQYIRPKMIKGWWQREIAGHLQQFYEDLIAGERPILVIQAPPQHGKSEQIVDFIAWLAGKNPDCKSIYTSFSERLGIKANLNLQRLYSSPKYQSLFPGTSINAANVVTQAGQPQRNQEMIEYVGCSGSFRNTTVRGMITGEGLDLGIIDDPLKGREAANSEAIRNKTWDWFTDDFFSRFSDHAGLLFILTRWHIDDPVGRLTEQDPSIEVVSYPAIATEDEEHRKQGEPLFPEHKPLDFLEKRRSLMLESSWESLYQQNPIPRESCTLKAERIEIGIPGKIRRAVRYWDKAGTADGGAYTAGVLVGEDKDRQYWILDVIRKQLSALDRERLIRQTAETDGHGVPVWIEQEPGSGGKESAENTVRNLAGYTVKIDRVSGDKVFRAGPLEAQIEAGNLKLQRAAWNAVFLDEARMFPAGKYKDQIDAASGAFNKLAGSKGIDYNALNQL